MVLPDKCPGWFTIALVVVIVVNTIFSSKKSSELKAQVGELKEQLTQREQAHQVVIKDKDSQLEEFSNRKVEFENAKNAAEAQVKAKTDEVARLTKERDDARQETANLRAANTNSFQSLQDFMKTNKPKPYVINEGAPLTDQFKGMVEYLIAALRKSNATALDG